MSFESFNSEPSKINYQYESLKKTDLYKSSNKKKKKKRIKTCSKQDAIVGRSPISAASKNLLSAGVNMSCVRILTAGVKATSVARFRALGRGEPGRVRLESAGTVSIVMLLLLFYGCSIWLNCVVYK